MNNSTNAYIDLSRDKWKKLENATYNETPSAVLDGYITYAKCVKVYDGDTAHFAFFSSKTAQLHRESIRLKDYDTEELRGGNKKQKEDAKLARQHLINLIEGKIVYIQFCGEDKYGRPIAKIWIDGSQFLSHSNPISHHESVYIVNSRMETAIANGRFDSDVYKLQTNGSKTIIVKR